MAEVEVTQEEAIKFLESACRNWGQIPPLSKDDLDDVANALASFARHHVRRRAALENRDD